MQKFLEEFQKFHRNKEEFNKLIASIVFWLGKNKLRDIYNPTEIVSEFYVKVINGERAFVESIKFEAFIYETCKSIVNNYGKNNRKHHPPNGKKNKKEDANEEVFNPPEIVEVYLEDENFDISVKEEVKEKNEEQNDESLYLKNVFGLKKLTDEYSIYDQYGYMDANEIIELIEKFIKNDPKKVKILSFARNIGYDNKYDLIKEIQKETKIPKKIIEDELNQIKMLIKQIWSESEL